MIMVRDLPSFLPNFHWIDFSLPLFSFSQQAKKFLLTVVILGLAFPALQAQTLTERDKQDIKIAAEQVIFKLEILLNTLTDKNRTQAEKRRMIRDCYKNNSISQIFFDHNVNVFDDIDPLYTTNFGSAMKLSVYLNRFLFSYDALGDKKSIRFSNPRVIKVEQGRDYPFARVFFWSKFGGAYKRESDKKYKHNVRVAEIRAVRSSDGWRATIAHVSFASEQEIKTVYPDTRSFQLIKDIKDAQDEMRQDLIKVDKRVDKLLKQINERNPREEISPENINRTYLEASKYASEADSLAAKAKKDCEKINYHIAIQKVKAAQIDSLLTLQKAEINLVKKAVTSYQSKLKQIAGSAKNAQEHQAEAEVAFYFVDTLLKRVPKTVPQKAPIGEIIANYDKASAGAKEVESAAKGALENLKMINESINEMREIKKRSEIAQQRANSYQRQVETSLEAALADRQRAEHVNRGINSLLTKADSAVNQMDKKVGPAIRNIETSKLEWDALSSQITDEVFSLRLSASEAQNRAELLNEAAILTNNEELIQEARTVIDLARDIFYKVDQAQPSFTKAMDDAQKASQMDSKTRDMIEQIIQLKHNAEAEIRSARQALQRAKFVGGGAEQVISAAKRSMESLRNDKQAAFAENSLVSDYLEDADRELTSTKEAYNTANKVAVDVNHNVNRAYHSVVKRSLTTRRWNAPYLGLNYNFFNSSQLRAGTLPPYNNPGFQKFGLSLYYRVGAFFNNMGSIATDEIPDHAYSLYEVDNHQSELIAKNEPFDTLSFVSSGGNFKNYSFGVYLSPVRHVYLMAGLSVVRGTEWDYYSGDYPGLVTANGSAYYAIDKNPLYTSDFLFGAAFVWPYVQFEVGYNNLRKDVFLNMGVNIPLRRTYTLIRTHRIDRDEYDQLINEWKKNR